MRPMVAALAGFHISLHFFVGGNDLCFTEQSCFDGHRGAAMIKDGIFIEVRREGRSVEIDMWFEFCFLLSQRCLRIFTFSLFLISCQ